MERPALRAATLTVLAEVTAVTVDMPVWTVIPVLAGLLMLVLIRPTWASAAAPVALGVLLSTQATETLPPRLHGHVREAPARIEGMVERILYADTTRLRCVVRGVIDRQDLPPTSGAAMVTVWRPDPRLRGLIPGARIVGSGRCDGPAHGHLPADRMAAAAGRAHDAWWRMTIDASRLDVTHPPTWHARLLHDVRRRIDRAVRSVMAPDVAPIMLALLTGDERAIEPHTRDAFARTGTAHMFSVSGSHVAVLATVLTLALSWISVRWRLWCILGCLCAFVVVTGAQPPAVRALMATLFVLWGRHSERDVDGMNLLGAAILVMVVLDPALPWRISAQLSVCGVLGILLLTRPMMDMLHRCSWTDVAAVRPLRMSLSVSLAASAGVAIPSALTFDAVSIISPLANIVVVPLLSTAMLCGGLAVATPGGDAYAAIAELCVRWSVRVTDVMLDVNLDVPWSVPMAIVLTAGTAWIARAPHRRALLWRMTSWTTVALLLGAMPAGESANEVLLRRDCIVVIRRTAVAPIVIIADRRHADGRPRRDHAVVSYIADTKPLCILERGMGASGIVDAIEDRTAVRRLPYLGHR